MKVRVGIVDSERLVELEVEDAGAFEKQLAADFAASLPLLWFKDSKGRHLAVPLDKVAFVEIEAAPETHQVGFVAG